MSDARRRQPAGPQTPIEFLENFVLEYLKVVNEAVSSVESNPLLPSLVQRSTG